MPTYANPVGWVYSTEREQVRKGPLEGAHNVENNSLPSWNKRGIQQNRQVRFGHISLRKQNINIQFPLNIDGNPLQVARGFSGL